jgi:spermidine synthase
MTPWELLGKVSTPGSAEVLTLHRRGGEFVIKVDGHLLMTNLTHASEDALAAIGCARIAGVRAPSVLIGGLGMGFTLAAALGRLGPDARLFVAELVPAVVEWNRGPLSHLAGHPLRDRRVTVIQQDIAAILRTERGAYDAILQDVDNGPEGLTLKANDWLYSEAGLKAAASALRPNGVLALWSAKPNREFVKRLRKTGFDVQEIPVRSRERHRGAHHIVWTAALRPARGVR